MRSKTKPVRHDLMVRRDRVGYLFIMPFLIGFLLFVGIPIVQSIIYSFHDVQIVESGYLFPAGYRIGRGVRGH